MTAGWEIVVIHIHKLCLFLPSSPGITDGREVTSGMIQFSCAAFLLEEIHSEIIFVYGQCKDK